MINKINFNTTTANCYQLSAPKTEATADYKSDIQTSIYNQKGVNVPFCGLAKGIDEAEYVCIRMLRKAKGTKLTNGRGAPPRKFSEQDIKEILADLRKIKKADDKKHIIEEVLTIEDESTGLKPDKNIIKKLVKLIADKPDSERYALLEYAQNDLKTVYEPLSAFIRMPEEKHSGLINILKDINDVNEEKFFKTKAAKNETIDSLYEHFREVLYADEELSKLPPVKAKDYKLETIDVLNNDIKFFIKESEKFSNTQAQNQVVSIAHKVLSYFIENIK